MDAGNISLVAENIGGLAPDSRYINIESNLAHTFTLNLNIAGRSYQYTIPAGQYSEKVLLGEAEPQAPSNEGYTIATTGDTSLPLAILTIVLLLSAPFVLIASRRKAQI